MIDLNQVNDSQIIPISKEECLINELKPSAFNSIKIWIESVTCKYFLYPNDFRKSLADGILLCNLLNCLKPGTIKRINKVSTAISGYDESPAIDNLGKFLRCCEDDFGLSPLILFKISDLEDLTEKLPNSQLDSVKRLERVLMCLFHLAKSVENQLTNITIDSTPFNLLLKSQDLREMKKNKINSNSEDSVFESPVPELIQKQTPDYLANKAEETLKQTKMNQEILHRSLEGDDWQESLENWREKRRQVLSQSLVETTNNDLNSGDSKELTKLKEKARKMKQLRDQIKNQSIQNSNDQPDGQNAVSIPDIDDEMKAMIERVKMKKLAEEQKRQFSVSSPTKTSFTSDSEPSTSTAVEKLENSLNISEKNESESSLSYGSNQLSKEVSKNNLYSNEINIPNKVPESSKTRVIQVKISQRSKQDSDQLWGMDLVDRSGTILVSKVKIGSSSDVCDVRKGDEIVSINSKDVTNQSIEFVKSIFNKYASVISPTEYITLSLRRLIDDDEDEDFLCSDISETIDDNLHTDKPEFEPNSETHLNDSNIKSIITNTEQIDHLNSDLIGSQVYPNTTKEIPENVYEKANKSLTVSETIEKRQNYDEDSLFYAINNISIINSEIPHISAKNTSEIENEFQVSVQAKIAKFECQNVTNPIKINQNTDYYLTNTKYIHQSSCEGLSWNLNNISSKSTEINHSSISNLYHYWDTEAAKSVPSSNQNLINISAPLGQTPIHSVSNEGEKNEKCLVETAEQLLNISNANIGRTWKNSSSSGHSSTSDDVSALNETIIMSQCEAWNKSIDKSQENPININEKSNPAVSLAGGFSSGDYPISTAIMNKFTTSDINYNTGSNVSTGIQANFQSRQQPIYTTITTAFENQSKKSATNSTSKILDEDSYLVSFPKFPGNIDNNVGNITPIEMEQPIQNPQMPWLPYYNKKDVGRDSTSITPSIIEKVNQKIISDTYLSRTIGSNVVSSMDDNEKSIEIEVSVASKLFPMKFKTLFSKSTDDKNLSHRTNDPVVMTRSFDEDERTLKSDYIKVMDLDDTIPPMNQKSNSSIEIDNINASSHKTEEMVYSDVTKAENIPNQSTIDLTNANSFDLHPKNDYSNIFESNIDIEPTISIMPAPILFKGNQNSDNTISTAITLSKSENFNSLKNESSLSTRKSKKNNSKPNEWYSKRSSSTKELRYFEGENTSDVNRSNISYRDNSNRTSTTTRKYSPSQVTFSDVIQDITQTKIQTKTISIEKSLKTAPISSTHEKKKSKSQNKKSRSAEISMKCSNCSKAAGSEDLMVIEELNLHFHLRCFTCSECKVQLGDGKSDTDVRIRRSKLHCAICYNKKSSKSKHRNPAANRQQQSVSNNISNKGGHGDGHSVYIAPGDSNNNCAFPTALTSVPSA